VIKWARNGPSRLPRKRKKQRRTSLSDARQEKYVLNWPLPYPSYKQSIVGSHISTGNRADERGYEEQAASKRPRSKAPRFVSSLSSLPHLLQPSVCTCHRNASFIEKENDKKALAAIKAQIEADKRDRAQKAAQEKAIREGGTTAAATTSAPAPAVAAAAPATSSIPGREFKETRLQIRLASGGQPLTTTLPSDSSCVPSLSPFEKLAPPLIDCDFPIGFLALREVAEFVAGQSLTVDVDTVTFTQHFPRCVFYPSNLSPDHHVALLTPDFQSIIGNNFLRRISPGLSVVLD
jgi:hypothetical protein